MFVRFPEIMCLVTTRCNARGDCDWVRVLSVLDCWHLKQSLTAFWQNCTLFSVRHRLRYLLLLGLPKCWSQYRLSAHVLFLRRCWVVRMATGGASFDDCADEQELHNWTVTNGSLEDRLNNMVWEDWVSLTLRSNEVRLNISSTASSLFARILINCFVCLGLVCLS